jgi:hypothetical protein
MKNLKCSKSIFLKAISGLYYYYSKGATQSIPYFSTILLLVLLVFIHLMQCFVILKKWFGITVLFQLYPENAAKLVKMLLLGLWFTPVYIVLLQLFPEQKLVESGLTVNELSKYKTLFFFYFFGNLILFLILISNKIVFDS